MTEWTIDETFESYPDPLPACTKGVDGHDWVLSIEEGRIALGSGCEQCDEAVLGPAGADALYMQEIVGSMVFVPDHLGGWHGLTRCDCGWSWEFKPVGSKS